MNKNKLFIILAISCTLLYTVLCVVYSLIINISILPILFSLIFFVWIAILLYSSYNIYKILIKREN